MSLTPLTILITFASLFVVASALFIGYFTQRSVPDERAWLVKRISAPLLSFVLRWYGAITGVLLGVAFRTPVLIVVIALNVVVGLLDKRTPWRTAFMQIILALIVIVVEFLTQPVMV